MKKMIVPSLKALIRHRNISGVSKASRCINSGSFDLEGYSEAADALRKAYWSTGDKDLWDIAMYLMWEMERMQEN